MVGQKKKNNLHNRERRQVTRSRKEFYNTARSLRVLSDLVPLSVRSLGKSGSVPLYERESLSMTSQLPVESRFD